MKCSKHNLEKIFIAYYVEACPACLKIAEQKFRGTHMRPPQSFRDHLKLMDILDEIS